MATYTIIGLGNPGEEYIETRHNVGMILLDTIFKKYKNADKTDKTDKIADWKEDGVLKALTAQVVVAGKKVNLIKPQTFMNKSGQTVAGLINSIKSKKNIDKFAENLLVIHDDLDIGLGKAKVSFNKSSGGHRGIESIIKVLKTEAFMRLRIGISPVGAKGLVKKPKGEEAVNDFIIGKFKTRELETITSLSKPILAFLENLVEHGYGRASSQFRV